MSSSVRVNVSPVKDKKLIRRVDDLIEADINASRKTNLAFQDNEISPLVKHDGSYLKNEPIRKNNKGKKVKPLITMSLAPSTSSFSDSPSSSPISSPFVKVTPGTPKKPQSSVTRTEIKSEIIKTVADSTEITSFKSYNDIMSDRLLGNGNGKVLKLEGMASKVMEIIKTSDKEAFCIFVDEYGMQRTQYIPQGCMDVLDGIRNYGDAHMKAVTIIYNNDSVLPIYKLLEMAKTK